PRVVGAVEAVHPRKCTANARLLLVVVATGEHEMVVGNGGLARNDRMAAGDLVEGVDGECRRAGRSREQIHLNPEGGAPRPAPLTPRPPWREDSTGAANLVLFRREGNRLVRPVLRQVRQPPRGR